MSSTDYLKFSRKFLEGTGLVPTSSLCKKLLSLLVFLPVCLVLNFLVVYQFARAKGDILLIAEAFESLSTYGQLTVRKYQLLLHGNLIEEVMRDWCQNWEYNLFGDKIETELRRKMELCIKMTKTLAFCSTGTITLMCVTALIDDKKLVPLTCFVPNYKWAAEIIFISEVIILFETLYYVVALDSFYLLNCMNLETQFTLMRELIKSIRFGADDDSECLQKLVRCAQHHKSLLRLHQKLNKVYSEYFILQYTITVTAVSIQAYLTIYRLVQGHYKLLSHRTLKSVVYFFTVMLQVALYFIPASNVEIEAENYSLEIYSTNWEANTNNKIGKHLLFMLMKSQKSLNLLGAGMLHVNRPEYLAILRLGFTIATILGGLK
ncbi:hypothetical protein MTP99_012261 [Tenebrio molitor]|nr:hypothetical protein MTP99_012261 [Tenebrio molitor]